MSERGTATQAGHMHHYVAAVSPSNISPAIMHTAYPHTVSIVQAQNGFVCPPITASSKEGEMSERGTATQDGYMHDYVGSW